MLETPNLVLGGRMRNSWSKCLKVSLHTMFSGELWSHLLKGTRTPAYWILRPDAGKQIVAVDTASLQNVADLSSVTGVGVLSRDPKENSWYEMRKTKRHCGKGRNRAGSKQANAEEGRKERWKNKSGTQLGDMRKRSSLFRLALLQPHKCHLMPSNNRSCHCFIRLRVSSSVSPGIVRQKAS